MQKDSTVAQTHTQDRLTHRTEHTHTSQLLYMSSSLFFAFAIWRNITFVPKVAERAFVALGHTNMLYHCFLRLDCVIAENRQN